MIGLAAFLILNLALMSPATEAATPRAEAKDATLESEAAGNRGKDKESERESDQILNRYLQVSGKGIVRGVTMMAHFVGRLPKMEKSATLNAKRHVTKDGVIEYDTTDRQGDVTIQKYLIATFINGEMENSGKSNAKVSITPENYKFKYKGHREKDGRTVYVFDINPRKKRDGLFKGEIWLDSDTGLTVREAGRFVKSPSVFLKRVDFAREYSIRDGYAVPKLVTTSIETRFWGNAELDIQYSAFAWEEQGVLN